MDARHARVARNPEMVLDSTSSVLRVLRGDVGRITAVNVRHRLPSGAGAAAGSRATLRESGMTMSSPQHPLQESRTSV